MMVRVFLRISRNIRMALVYPFFTLVLVLAITGLPTAAIANEHDVNTEIGKFMAAYTRDLAKRLGTGTHIDYAPPTVPGDAEARPCSSSLSVNAKDSAQSLNRVTLFIACGNEWSIYLPVDFTVSRPVVIAVKPLANGDVIGTDDVQLSPLDVGQLSGTYFTRLEDAVGMAVKRPIMQGRPIIAQQLAEPLLVRRGDSVVISAEADVLAVKMTGTALSDGRRGEQIRIKNQTSSRIIDARVVAAGQVEVPM